MISVLLFLSSIAGSAVYLLYRYATRISISQVRGPKSDSWIMGNMMRLVKSEAGVIDRELQEEYGDIVRVKGLFGEDRLLVSDPRALQYIYQTSGYHWHKPWERRELSRLIGGQGLTWAEGEVHKRQRKIMLPGFGTPESRSFLPIFFGYAAKLTTKWKDMFQEETHDSAITVNVPFWISRVALDAIGEAAFDYRFGATDDAENVLAKSYNNLLAETFGAPSAASLFTISTWGYLPKWLRNLMQQRSRRLHHARETARLGNEVAKSLIESKAEELLQGRPGSRDIMSLLGIAFLAFLRYIPHSLDTCDREVRSNASENEKTRMSEVELISQMRTLLLAGHETTATTMSWTLYELARHPEMQQKLRAEIWEMENELRAQGRVQYEASDLDRMPYTTAVIKESLRFYPVLHHTFKQAGRDDVLPLSTPIITKNGETITELPVPKGTRVIASIIGYNRNTSVFGEDTHTYNPERWLRDTPSEKKRTNVGVYANLLTFTAGMRACIGWRFAVLELHAILIELVGNFEFEMTPRAKHIRREPCVVVVPTVEGELGEGVQLPLQIRIARREEVDG